jgi:cation transporter-like permease
MPVLCLSGFNGVMQRGHVIAMPLHMAQRGTLSSGRKSRLSSLAMDGSGKSIYASAAPAAQFATSVAGGAPARFIFRRA